MGGFPFREDVYFLVTPPRFPRYIGIIELASKLEVIYGAQSLTGKILSRKDLGRHCAVHELRARSQV